MRWLEEVRTPYAPPVCLQMGETEEGHIVTYAIPGQWRAVDFVKKRPDSHTLDFDIDICILCLEWLMKRLDDRSREKERMLYLFKIVDMKNLGQSTLPPLVPEIRKALTTHGALVMARYCDQDIYIMVLNAPLAFRVVWAFAKTIAHKRQRDRMHSFSSALAAEPQAVLKKLLPAHQLPVSLGGTRTAAPGAWPFAWEDPVKVSAFMARSAPAFTRGRPPRLADTAPPPELPELGADLEPEQGTFDTEVVMPATDDHPTGSTGLSHISSTESHPSPGELGHDGGRGGQGGLDGDASGHLGGQVDNVDGEIAAPTEVKEVSVDDPAAARSGVCGFFSCCS